ncbi:MAG: MerR family transcriptional regulator [Myxococcales bacterium]|nr:MerR family transcriptional regulator [Myxococcales bacterium]
MKRSLQIELQETLPKPAVARVSPVLDEPELQEIERTWPNGLSSRQLVDVFESRGVRFSEATLRKYVQLGLLPRSTRIGRKGKHKGSLGIYPPNVVRRVNVVKKMMADNHTIEEIQRAFVRFKDEIDAVEMGLRALIAGMEREARDANLSASRRQALEKEIHEARKAAADLVRRIADLEQRLSMPEEDSGPAVGGGTDLF